MTEKQNTATNTAPPASQQINLRFQDLTDAEQDGLITKTQALALWQRWSATPAHDAGPKFGLVNVLYYFGGMVAIGAMSLFMTLGFQSMGAGGLLAIALAYLFACLKVADHFKVRGLPVPAGLLATLAVVRAKPAGAVAARGEQQLF